MRPGPSCPRTNAFVDAGSAVGGTAFRGPHRVSGPLGPEAGASGCWGALVTGQAQALSASTLRRRTRDRAAGGRQLYALHASIRPPAAHEHPPGRLERLQQRELLSDQVRSDALLVDTGFPAQREALFAMLDALLEPESHLALMPLRAGEVGSLGNVMPLCSRYAVNELYCMLPFGYVRDMDVRTLAERRGDRADAPEPTSVVLGGATPSVLAIGGTGEPRIEWFRPMLQLLSQVWAYDPGRGRSIRRRRLAHTSSAWPSGPWVIDEAARDPTTVEDLMGFLRHGNRSWWLPGADGRRIADWLREVFAARVVERIAPAFGCVLEGRTVVERQVGLMCEALERLAVAGAVGEAG